MLLNVFCLLLCLDDEARCERCSFQSHACANKKTSLVYLYLNGFEYHWYHRYLCTSCTCTCSSFIYWVLFIGDVYICVFENMIQRSSTVVFILLGVIFMMHGVRQKSMNMVSSVSKCKCYCICRFRWTCWQCLVNRSSTICTLYYK